MCHMVGVIAKCTKMRMAEAPACVEKTQHQNLRPRYHPRSVVTLKSRTSPGRLQAADKAPVGALATLPCHHWREGAVNLKPVYLPVLIRPESTGRHALARFPGTFRPQRPVTSAHIHPLST